MFSVPVGEIKPQGVYDTLPTKGVSELQSSKKVCVHVYAHVHAGIQDRQTQENKTSIM